MRLHGALRQGAGRTLLGGAALALALAACGSPTSGKSAEELYGEHCERCHGADGRGDTRVLSLAPRANLTRSPLVRKKQRGALFRTISQGTGSMPAFSHKLERGDVEMLVEYVLAFEEP